MSCVFIRLRRVISAVTRHHFRRIKFLSATEIVDTGRAHYLRVVNGSDRHERTTQRRTACRCGGEEKTTRFLWGAQRSDTFINIEKERHVVSRVRITGHVGRMTARNPVRKNAASHSVEVQFHIICRGTHLTAYKQSQERRTVTS